MNDRELDEILNEIRRRSLGSDAVEKPPVEEKAEESAAPEEAPAQEESTAEEIAEPQQEAEESEAAFVMVEEEIPQQSEEPQEESVPEEEPEIEEAQPEKIEETTEPLQTEEVEEIQPDFSAENWQVEEETEPEEPQQPTVDDNIVQIGEDEYPEVDEFTGKLIEEFDVASSDAEYSDDEYEEIEMVDNSSKNKKKIIIAIVAVVLVIAIGVGVYFGFFYKKSEEPTTTKPPVQGVVDTEPVAETGPLNPLTGESGYNADAVGKRPVAVVAENEYSTASVRPQWGIADADIVMEGETEYSTRLLLFWADYTKVPEMVGPTRSARPPFIRFSQLFDSIFIHAGLSHTKGNYIGADSVFKNENVDHINGLNDSMNGTYFGRNKERTSTIEHTAYLNGKNLPELLEKKGFNTALNESKFTSFKFNEEAKPLSDTSATEVHFTWSDVYTSGKCPKTAKFSYDADKKKYVTADFDSSFGESGVEFENLIFLLDETEYIVKQNYKHGRSETYCDYKLSGGKGTVLSQGTAVEITWGVTAGKLWMKTADGNELLLNSGKSYIGYGSSNKGGAVKLNPNAQ